MKPKDSDHILRKSKTQTVSLEDLVDYEELEALFCREYLDQEQIDTSGTWDD